MAFLTLNSDSSADLTVTGIEGKMIENEVAKLEIVEVQEEYIMFKLTDKKTGDQNFLNFGFRFWPSYEWSKQPSGVYIFRPKNINDSIVYSSIVST